MKPTAAPTLNRRRFLAGAAALSAGAALSLSGFGSLSAMAAEGPLTQPALPYAMDALAPTISKRTLEFHYGKHHAGYVRKANKFLAGSPLEHLPIEEIISTSYGDPARKDIFNNTAQVFNHTFYWNSMKPGGGGKPTGAVRDAIDAGFGTYEQFAEAFARVAGGRFASGWAWLVVLNGKLRVMDTMNADTPVAHGMTPLLTIDVWEHAYYLDYQNRRGDYITAWLDNLVNWDFAAANLAKA